MSRKEPFLNTREEEVLDDTVTGYEYEGIIKSPDTQSVNSKRADTNRSSPNVADIRQLNLKET